MIRDLGSARLSRDDDESTSIPRQKNQITIWSNSTAQLKGEARDLIDITEDSDVSGAISPCDRDGLGPFLRPPKLSKWDNLIITRLDRLTRSIQDFEALWTFLEANGKTLVSIAESIDFNSVPGRMIARQLVIFAEYEREMISQRVRDAYRALNQRGQYPGGAFPFGYLPKKLDPKGWGFMPHPLYSATVSEIVEKLLSGESLGAICRWLEEQSIPTPRNVVRLYGNEIREREGRPLRPIPESHWRTTSLAKILRSPAIVGEVVTTGGPLRDSQRQLNKRTAPKPVTDPEGFAVKRLADPLISRRQWEEVQKILDHNSERAGPRVNSSPLLHVAYCAWCKSPLYINSVVTDGKRYRYYVCPNANRGKGCKSRRIDADWLEGEVERIYLAEVGDLPETKEIVTPPSDNTARIMELAEAVGRLESQATAIEATAGDASKLRATQDVHRRNIKELGRERSRPAEIRVIVTDETKGQVWARLDSAGRNALLRKDGWRIDAARDGRKAPQVRLATEWREGDVDEQGQVQLRGYYQPWPTYPSEAQPGNVPPSVQRPD